MFYHLLLLIALIGSFLAPQSISSPPLPPTIQSKPAYSNKVQQEISVQSKKYGVDTDLAMAISFCESRHDEKAKNPSSSARGAFQILDMHGLSVECRFNAECNVRWAMEILSTQGTKPWNASKYCWGK